MDLSSKTVLLVEDEADIREALIEVLGHSGFQVVGANNGVDALCYLRASPPPALILLDLMMPIMDGWEFRRRQREDPALADVPVVVLSALDQTRAADLGGTAFLKKPLDFDRLLDLVRQHCRDPR